eukprot:scaffold3.g6472.t1
MVEADLPTLLETGWHGARDGKGEGSGAEGWLRWLWWPQAAPLPPARSRLERTRSRPGSASSLAGRLHPQQGGKSVEGRRLAGSKSAGQLSDGSQRLSIRGNPALRKQRYEARAAAWHARLEAAKAKAEARAKAAAAGGGGAPGAGAKGPRVVSRHWAIPVRPASSSGHPTPQGSPKPAYLDGSLPPAPPPATKPAPPALDVPPCWQGWQTAEVPVDLGACSPEQLARFLRQAGWGGASPGAVELLSHEELVAAAREARGQWEVERIMQACEFPEEVLRVPRGCADPAVLKAAWRRVSMAVHPDKCRAEGASDAMAVVVDCFAMLSHAGKAVAAVPAFMRQREHRAGSGSAPAPTAAAAAADTSPGGASRPQLAEPSGVPIPTGSSGSAAAEAGAAPTGVDATSAAFVRLGPRRSSSSSSGLGSEGRAAPTHHQRSSSDGGGWHPHHRLSSEEEALASQPTQPAQAAERACEWDTGPPADAPAQHQPAAPLHRQPSVSSSGLGSRLPSLGSLSRAWEATAGLLPRRGSSASTEASLADPGTPHISRQSSLHHGGDRSVPEVSAGAPPAAPVPVTAPLPPARGGSGGTAAPSTGVPAGAAAPAGASAVAGKAKIRVTVRYKVTTK